MTDAAERAGTPALDTDRPEAGPAVCGTGEAARRLGVSSTTVQLMVERGELVGWKTRGGHRRILLESVERAARLRGVRSAESVDGPSAVVLVLVDADAVRRDRLLAEIAAWPVPTRVRIATDPLEAALLVERHRPDLLLLQPGLPTPGGRALAAALRRHPELDGTAIVLVDGAGDAGPDAPRGVSRQPAPLSAEALRGFVEALRLRRGALPPHGAASPPVHRGA